MLLHDISFSAPHSIPPAAVDPPPAGGTWAASQPRRSPPGSLPDIEHRLQHWEHGNPFPASVPAVLIGPVRWFICPVIASYRSPEYTRIRFTFSPAMPRMAFSVFPCRIRFPLPSLPPAIFKCNVTVSPGRPGSLGWYTSARTPADGSGHQGRHLGGFHPTAPPPLVSLRAEPKKMEKPGVPNKYDLIILHIPGLRYRPKLRRTRLRVP